MFNFSCSLISFLSYTGRSWSMKQPCLSNCYGQMSGCSGNRRVPVCFDVKLEPFLDTNLIFSRADYNSRKSNKNRCVFHLLSVMYQLTENKQNTMMLCENATITWTETPEQRRYVWKLFLQLISGLAGFFPRHITRVWYHTNGKESTFPTHRHSHMIFLWRFIIAT